MSLLEAPKLYLDEHLSPRLSLQLRRHGFDVISTHDAEMLSQSDDAQLTFAISQQRVLVTINFRDFQELHGKYSSENLAHWGIVFTTEERFSVLIHRLLRLLNSLTADDLKNQIRWLNEFR